MDGLWTVAYVAELLGVSVKSVYTWAECGALPHVKVGRLLRFRPADIEAWVAANAREAR